jgi:predicted nucleotidyltransferase
MILAKYLGGSHMYSLSTPESDIDEREIFLNEDPAYILGTKRFDQEVKNNEQEDVYKVELRKFLELTKKGNTQSIEVLFANDSSFEYLDPIVKEMRKNRNKLVDSDKLFKVISSFIHAQKFLMFDDKRKVKEGSKRATEIEKYGYVPKAAVTAIRLAVSGIYFFRGGNYRVEVGGLAPVLKQVKFHPETFTADDMRDLVEDWDTHLKEVYDRTEIKTIFDEDYANNLLVDSYMPFLNQSWLDRKK